MSRGSMVAAGLFIGVLAFIGFTLRSRGPALSPRDVVNAADRRGGGVAPREIVVLHPSHVGPLRLVEWPTIFPRSAADMDYLRQRPEASGTRVFFDKVPAPVVYSVSGEVEAIIPDSVDGRAATEIVVEYNGARSRALKLPVIQAAPAIFTLDASGTGQAAMLNETGCCNSARNPALRGSIASLYATGEGLLHARVNVTVGNVPAEVVYAGNVGMLVVNFRVPRDAPPGALVPIVLTVGKTRSRNGVTMAIRESERGIVIVDRDPAIRGRLNDALRRSYNVFEAGDWKQAEDFAAKNSIDLVIMDQEMTSGAATEALRIIGGQHPLAKIIVLADDGSPQFLRQVDLLGVNAILPRTAEGTELVSRVQYLLRERPARY